MRSKLILLIAALFFSVNCFAFSFGSLFGFSKQEKPAKPLPPAIVVKQGNLPIHTQVGVYVMHVGKYDLQSANIQMDFYLIFQCKPVCENINFEIMNATNSTTHLVARQKDNLIYRVQANLNKADSLRSYPFDSHSIDIVIENREATTDKMVFEVDPKTTQLDSDLNVVGFHILPNWTANVTNHFYSVFQRTFSSYKFSIYIARPLLAGILKCILPAFIIICCNFLALFMKLNHVSQRLGIATSTLIAAEVFHLNLTSSLPPLGYVTYADMFMFINYFCLFIVLIEVVLTTYFIDTKHHTIAERINQVAAGVIPLCWLVLQIIVWLIFMPTSVIQS